MNKKDKNYKPWQSVRKPIPKPDRPMSTKKGKKGYSRKEFKIFKEDEPLED